MSGERGNGSVAMIKLFFRWLVRALYGFRAHNVAVLNTPGPVLLIPNHVSWLDWLFLVLCLDGDWRFVVSSTSAETSWLHRKIMINRRTFPVDTASPYAAKRMAEYLQKNGRLVLFAEGRLSRTGCLMKLFDGTGFLLHKTNAKVITCFLRGAHRLPFSPNKDEKKWFQKVTAHFSDVLTPPRLEHLSTTQSRTLLTNWLRDKMIFQQFDTEMQFGERTVPEAIIATARAKPKHVVLEDVAAPLNYRRLLVGASLLGGQFARRIAANQRRVGVLLPNVNGTPVTLLALWAIGKTPALLNYSTGSAVMLACCQLAGLKQVITSRAFIEKARLKLESLIEAGVELIYLEDIRKQITGGDKLLALLRVRLAPASILKSKPAPEDAAAILFTSGSEGVPKGVELTHTNILANIRQMLAVCDLQDWDRFFNALPIFHSFGLTIGTLLSLVRGCHVMLYPSPLHYRVVPTAFYQKDATIMLGTNTFLNGYARKAHALDWRSLRYMFAGAEKLQDATAATWSQKFGVRVLEGYGATECSPCVSGNTPLVLKYGSAGKLLPGIECKLQPVEGVTEGGRLFVRGPNVMRGYLNLDANAAFQKLGGWYDTGDIARVDEEGFVFILGRLKRFAKISGEMVSLTAVEEALAGAFPQYGLRCQVAVVSKPDADKGEILIAVANDAKLQLDEVRSVLRAKGFPNLCVPREVKFIRDIPKLGTGKVNHRELQQLV
jgi:acyl-[acyl-carrier-protein]-phospholipid O-acyltransferase/long-chain-fatty-acid--[acyl-carrier-protein] ligase